MQIYKNKMKKKLKPIQPNQLKKKTKNSIINISKP